MDGSSLQSLIYTKGYVRAAAAIGMPYNVFRPGSANNPVTGTPLIAGLPVSPNQGGAYKKPNSYGKPVWWSYHDGSQTRVGDYLVGDQGTFFIASQQDLLPIQLVQCNRTLSFYRVAQESGMGVVGYGGEVDADDTALMLAWPASVLEGSKGEKNPAGLPLDVKNPWWLALLPAAAGVDLTLADRVADELGNRYWVHQAELSEFGWRLKLMQVQA